MCACQLLPVCTYRQMYVRTYAHKFSHPSIVFSFSTPFPHFSPALPSPPPFISPPFPSLPLSSPIQLNLTSYTAAVGHLISHADEIGSVPNDVAKRALQLSKEFEGNLPPLLLAFNGGREATDFGVRRSMRRVRRKSASFSGKPSC